MQRKDGNPMIYRPSIALGFAALLALPHPNSLHAAPVVDPSVLQQAPTSASPGQGKIDEGVAALLRDDLASAEAAFKEAARLDPKLPAAYIWLAEVAGRRNNTALVDSWLQKALAADPNNANTLRTWGTQQFRRGRFADAEVTFKKAVAASPRSAEAHISLGENYLVGLKKPKAAEEAYRAAIAIDAGNAQAHLGLAASLAAQGRADDAVAAFEQAAKLAPKDPRPTHLLARFYASQVKLDQALAALDRAIAIAPDYLPAHLDRGDLYLVKNDLDRAAAAFREGAKATKEPAMAYFRLGVTLEAQQKGAEAEQAYLDAVKNDPLMYAAYNNLAYLAASRGERLDDALGWARKAIELAPKNMTLYDTLGWVHRARGEFDLAAKAIDKAIADNPKQANFRYHRGVVYADQGKNKEAVAELQKALELNKDFRNAGDAKARLQKLTGK